jgi:hypothetical protein
VLAGLGTGESPSLRRQLVDAMLGALPPAAPRLLSGVGTPEEVLEAVAQVGGPVCCHGGGKWGGRLVALGVGGGGAVWLHWGWEVGAWQAVLVNSREWGSPRVCQAGGLLRRLSWRRGAELAARLKRAPPLTSPARPPPSALAPRHADLAAGRGPV